MAKDKTTKLFAYETFMEQARKEGRVRNEELSMKVLKPDLALQARVNHIDKDHVRKLHEILKTARADGKDGHLAPIIVFEVATSKFKIADGNHRHDVYRQEKLPSIPCVVVTGTLQEAIEYAASCNQIMSLPRSREDARKAVFMLLANGWMNKPIQTISRHSGVSEKSVTKYIAEYCAEHGEKVPETKIKSDGTQMKSSRVSGEVVAKPHYVSPVNGQTLNSYTARVGGRTVKLGYSKLGQANAREGEAKEKLNELIVARGDKQRAIQDGNAVSYFLGARGIATQSAKASGVDGIKGGRVKQYVFTPMEIGETSARLFGPLSHAIGCAVLLAAHFGVNKKVILVTEQIRGYEVIVSIARRLGIEFMTLEQFAEAVKADEGDSPAAVLA